jgi:hypothetical protein
MSNISSMTAAKAYSTLADDLLAMVKGLEADVVDSFVDGRFANWGNVGDLQRALMMAQELRNVLRGKVK